MPAEMMAMFTESQRTMGEALRNIAQNTAHGRGRDQRQGPQPNQYSDLKDFLDTKLPIFKEAKEQLQADMWLNTIEQKFHLLRVTDQMKAEYASH
jgi:hypothetical protein